MNTEFIPYEQALTLKELGFDKPCFGYWKSKNWLIQEKTRTDGYTHADQECPAPIYQQAFKWFREKYNLSSWIYNSDMTKFFYTILQNGRIVKSHNSSTTYEEAELACLIKLIEIVKNK
jgi:hypothetical protein